MPFAFQLWQLGLVNNFEKLALYKKVRVLKTLTFFGALGLATREKLDLEYQWQFFDRLYPEATELQKSLYRDAMMFKELQYQEKL